jgi:acetyl-CoA acetyltransferase
MEESMSDIKNKVCVVGVGHSAFARVLDESPVRLQVEAMRNALDDAGLTKDAIDGFVTPSGSPGGIDYDEFAAHAGLNLRFVNQSWNHGRWASTSLINAALALEAGLCDYALIACTITTGRGYRRHFSRGGGGHGWSEGLRDVGGGHGEVDYHGLDTPGAGSSLIARDYMRRYGATNEELGTVAVTQRKHANLNPHAIMHERPMTPDDYMESRLISPPFRLFDYCLTNEGSCALILTTAERARDLKQPPVFLSGMQGVQTSRDDFSMFARPGMGVSFQTEYEYTAPSQPVYEMAGVTRDDIDALYVYDAFSTNVWMALERYGFCGEGEAHEWIQDGRIELGGELPLNTNGGLMSEGHYWGFSHLIEATRQLREECDERQVQGAEVVQWVTTFGDSLILTKGQ